MFCFVLIDELHYWQYFSLQTTFSSDLHTAHETPIVNAYENSYSLPCTGETDKNITKIGGFETHIVEFAIVP